MEVVRLPDDRAEAIRAGHDPDVVLRLKPHEYGIKDGRIYVWESDWTPFAAALTG